MIGTTHIGGPPIHTKKRSSKTIHRAPHPAGRLKAAGSQILLGDPDIRSRKGLRPTILPLNVNTITVSTHTFLDSRHILSYRSTIGALSHGNSCLLKLLKALLGTCLAKHCSQVDLCLSRVAGGSLACYVQSSISATPTCPGPNGNIARSEWSSDAAKSIISRPYSRLACHSWPSNATESTSSGPYENLTWYKRAKGRNGTAAIWSPHGERHGTKHQGWFSGSP